MKKFLLVLMTLFYGMCINAQIATENSNALDNIGIGITGGVSTPLDFNSVFPLNSNVGIKITKDVTPVFSFQVEGLAFLNDNHFSKVKTTIKAINVGLNGTINLTNAFYGYKGSPRKFEISTVGGLGWLHKWTTSENYLSAKTGLDFAYNFGKAHSIVLTPAVYWNLDKFSSIKFNKHNAQLAINATYIYHFKNSNGTHYFKTYDVGAMQDEIAELNRKLAEKPKVVEKVVEVKSAPVTNSVKTIDNVWVVSFAKGSSELSNEAKYVLDQIGENLVVNIEATASPEGTAEFNQKLSDERAETVSKYLTDRGLKVNSSVGKGVNTVSGRTATIRIAQ